VYAVLLARPVIVQLVAVPVTVPQLNELPLASTAVTVYPVTGDEFEALAMNDGAVQLALSVPYAVDETPSPVTAVLLV
jgi:hypothetical protein